MDKPVQVKPASIVKEGFQITFINHPPKEVLILSGGDANGAFGCGILNGWRKAPAGRPKFDVVTGVSTGALMAGFAFLGEEQDDVTLREIYTTLQDKDLFNLLNEGFGAGEGRPLRVPADAPTDGRHLGGEPEHNPFGFQVIHVVLPQDGPAACIDDQLVFSSQIAADLRLKVSKMIPAMLRDDLRDGPSGTTDDFGVGGHERATGSLGEQLADTGFSSAAVADENDIHAKRDSKTFRITSAGAFCLVQSSNCPTA